MAVQYIEYTSVNFLSRIRENEYSRNTAPEFSQNVTEKTLITKVLRFKRAKMKFFIADF